MTALSEPERLVRDALDRAVMRDRLTTEPHTAQHVRDLVAALRPLLAAEPDANANRLVQVARAMGMVGPETVPFGSGFEGMVMAATEGRRAVEAMEQQRTSAPKSGDDLGKLIQEALDMVVAARAAVRDRDPSTELHAVARKLLSARTLAAEAGKPEIVSAKEAAALPTHSVVRPCNGAGASSLIDRPLVIGVDEIDLRDPTAYHRVLSRAPAPAPKVGDVVRTEAELDWLPVGSVVRDGLSGVAQRFSAGWRYTDGTGVAAGVTFPARVLDLGDAS